ALLAHTPARAIAVLALDGRLAALLLALIVGIHEGALGTDDLRAVVAVGLEAVVADQRADPRRLLLDRIQRIGVDRLDVELRAGTAVELGQRTLRGLVPIAVGTAAVAADAAQFGLHRFGDLALRRRRIERSQIDVLVRRGRCRRRLRRGR